MRVKLLSEGPIEIFDILYRNEGPSVMLYHKQDEGKISYIL